jgi:hypothetical protein
MAQRLFWDYEQGKWCDVCIPPWNGSHTHSSFHLPDKISGVTLVHLTRGRAIGGERGTRLAADDGEGVPEPPCEG